VIFDEDIVYQNDDLDAAVRKETLVLAEVPPLPEEDQDDLLEFDTDQHFEGPRIELGTPIPSSPASPVTPACDREVVGHLPSLESLTLDDESHESPKANNEVDETDDIEDNFESSGVEVEARATSPNGSDDENGPEITFPSEQPPEMPSNTASTGSSTPVSTPSGSTPSASSGPSRGRGSRALQGLDSSNIQASRTRRRGRGLDPYQSAFLASSNFRLHRRDLPKAPESYEQAMAHEFAAEWRAATQTEIRGI